MEVKTKVQGLEKDKKEVDSWNAVTPDSGASAQRKDRTVSRDDSFDRGILVPGSWFLSPKQMPM